MMRVEIDHDLVGLTTRVVNRNGREITLKLFVNDPGAKWTNTLDRAIRWAQRQQMTIDRVNMFEEVAS